MVQRHSEWGADDALFTASKGGPLRNSNFRHYFFDPAVRRAGLEPLTPHNLRDTAASLAVASGANVKAVQRMLGHSSVSMTLDVYSGRARAGYVYLHSAVDGFSRGLHRAPAPRAGTTSGGLLADLAQQPPPPLVLSLLGAATLAVDAASGHEWGFLLLNAMWGAVSDPSHEPTFRGRLGARAAR